MSISRSDVDVVATSLAPEAVLNTARALEGRGDLHEAGVMDRLERLLTHLDRDLGLDAHGRQMAHETVADLVARRAALLEDRERYPEITQEVIERPLIVTGQARSGTTLLHSLIAADPNSRAPAWWDSMRPSPPPGISPPDDPRIAQMTAEMAAIVALQPNLLQSHPYFDEGGPALMECEKIAVLDLRYTFRSAFFRIPATLQIKLDDDDWTTLYAFHRMVLQALQWRRPKKRWALKGTEHHAHLGELKAIYPDAAIIWIHRDPQKVVPSTLELIASLAEGFTGKPVDRPTFGRLTLQRYQATLNAAMASPLIDHPDVVHLRYADFAADPVGNVECAYRRHGLPFNDGVRAAMQAWYDSPANKGDRHGKFRYDLSAFDMTTDDIEAAMSGYRARFNIPFEGGHR
jgi:hypothetical protein